MEKCEVCGREVNSYCKVKISDEKTIIMCQKHQHQWYEKGKITDPSPYSCMDKSTNEYIEYDDYYEIILRSAYNGYKEVGRAIIDKDDYERCKQLRWRLSEHKYKRKHGILIRRECVTGSPSKNNMTSLHRFILGLTKKCDIVDHINGNPLDNRKSNLRICTQQNNIWNKTKLSANNTSGVLGVYKDNRKGHKSNWIAEIKYNDIKIYLSAYINFEDAVYCRYFAEKLLFKEFSPTSYESVKQYIDKCNNKNIIEEKVKQRIKAKIHEVEITDYNQLNIKGSDDND